MAEFSDYKNELKKYYEMAKQAGLVKETVLSAAERKAKVDAIITSPNPIKQQTVGKDQDVTPQSLNATFSNEDLEKLEDMKSKLHELKDKANKADGLGDKAEAFLKQIEDLTEKIDQLSDSMCKGYDIMPQSD